MTNIKEKKQQYFISIIFFWIFGLYIYIKLSSLSITKNLYFIKQYIIQIKYYIIAIILLQTIYYYIMYDNLNKNENEINYKFIKNFEIIVNIISLPFYIFSILFFIIFFGNLAFKDKLRSWGFKEESTSDYLSSSKRL